MTPKSRDSRNGFRKLKSTDLKVFNQKASDMILRASEAGCLGRISNKGHVILRNNSGGTISISRNLSSNNHSLQKAEADLRRLLAGHTNNVEDDAPPKAAVNQTVRTTVSQAFLDYGSEFSAWFDTIEQGMSPDDQIVVTVDSSGKPSFEVQLTEQAEAEEPKHSTTDEQHQCRHCDRSFSTHMGLNAHQQAHQNLGPNLSTRILAEVNGLEISTVRRRISKVQNNPELASGTPEQKVIAAGLWLPANHEPEPAQKPEDDGPAADESASSENTQHTDAEILRSIRALLGDDPRITLMQSQIDELKTQLADTRAERDEALTRLSIIEEVFTV